MNPITQQFMMGAAGGKQTYWITKIQYSATSYANGGNNSLAFTSTDNIVIASGASSGGRATVFQMDDTATVAWYKSIGPDGSGEFFYYPTDKFNRVLVLNNGYIMHYGQVYDYNSSSRAGGIVVYNSSGSLQYQRELYTGAQTFILRSAIQFSNGNIMYGANGNFFNVMDSSGYASNQYTRQEYRILSGSTAFTPPPYPGGWLRTDGTNAYALGTVSVYNSGTDTTSYYIVILTVSDTLSFVNSYYYTVSGYYQNNAVYPFDFTKTSSGYYFVFATQSSNSTIYVTYTTSSVQWTRTISTSAYQISAGYNPLIASDSQGNCYVVFYSDGSQTVVTIIKYDTTGAIVWKRNITGTSTSQNGIGYAGVYKNALYVLAGGVLAKLSLSGSGIGTYGSYTYAESSQTDSAGPTVTQTSGTGTSQASSYTVLNVNQSWTTPTITPTTTQYLMS